MRRNARRVIRYSAAKAVVVIVPSIGMSAGIVYDNSSPMAAAVDGGRGQTGRCFPEPSDIDSFHLREVGAHCAAR